MDAVSNPPGAGETVSNSVLRRVGLSVLANNTDFEQQARREACDAESNLLEIQRRAGLQAARCRQHLESLEKEVRAEEEKRLISDRIGRELEVMKEEIRQREVREEEHLREVYRAILQPQQPRLMEAAYSAPRPLDTWQLQGSALDMWQLQADGAAAYPPIIASAVHLETSPVHFESPKLEVQARQLQPASADFFGPLALDSSLTAENLFTSGKGRARSSSQRRHVPGAASVHNGASRRRSSRGTAAAQSLERSAPGAAGSSEAQRLLKLNLSRLEKLEMLGL